MAVTTVPKITGVFDPSAAGAISGTSATLSGSSALSLTDTTAYNTAIQLGSAQTIGYEAANVTGLRNGVNAQTFAVYNTYTAGTPDYERLEQFWTSNTAIIRTAANGTGTARSLVLRYGNTTSAAITVGTTVNSGLVIGASGTSGAGAAVIIGNTNSWTALSGTVYGVLLNTGYSDGGSTSTTVAYGINFNSTINYTAASKTGKVVLAYFNPTLTSRPTGTNAGISFSSAFTSSTFPAMRFFNTSDEDTNTEWFEQGWHIASNVYGIRTNKAGTGTARVFNIYFPAGTNQAVSIPASASSPVTINPTSLGSSVPSSGRLNVGGAATTTATAGTAIDLLLNGGFAPSSTSTMAAYSLQIAPTINYSNGTPGAGYIYGVYINPTNTALPTGISAAIALSSTASALGGIRILNTSDETTNYEHLTIKYISNVLTFTSTVGGTGTPRGISFVVTDPAAQQLVNHTATSVITGAVTDGYCASLQITPTYNAGSALTVTRHNYIDINQVTLTGSALCTDACIMRFNAAAGTHKAVDSGTTKTSPGTVTQWLKFNVNGVVAYVPSYSSKTT